MYNKPYLNSTVQSLASQIINTLLTGIILLNFLDQLPLERYSADREQINSGTHYQITSIIQ